MITENVSALKINKLTQTQYNRELAAGNIKDNEIYLTPIEEVGVEDISDSFVITPDDDTAEYAEVNSVRVYKHGKVICGEIEIELSGAGECDTYWFSIQSPYVPTCMPTSSIVPLDEGAGYHPLSSVAFCHFGEGLMIQVYNHGVNYAIVAFTYICQ